MLKRLLEQIDEAFKDYGQVAIALGISIAGCLIVLGIILYYLIFDFEAIMQ